MDAMAPPFICRIMQRDVLQGVRLEKMYFQACSGKTTLKTMSAATAAAVSAAATATVSPAATAVSSASAAVTWRIVHFGLAA